MSTVIQIQHDASITTVTFMQSKAKPTVRHIYSAQITERTAIKIQISHLCTLLTVIHLPQPCLSPVSNHFSPQMCVLRPSNTALRVDQGREQGLCVRRNIRHKTAYSLIGWQTCHSLYWHLELNQSPQFNDTTCTLTMN